MALQTVQIASVGFGAVVGLSGEFDLELPLGNLFRQAEGESRPHERLAESFSTWPHNSSSFCSRRLASLRSAPRRNLCWISLPLRLCFQPT